MIPHFELIVNREFEIFFSEFLIPFDCLNDTTRKKECQALFLIFFIFFYGQVCFSPLVFYCFTLLKRNGDLPH